jgi:lysophospholipase L1-like esterase
MRRRSTLSVVAATLVLTGMVVAGVVALPGTGQAAGSMMRSHTSSKKVPLFYLSLGDSYSVGYQPGMGATAGYTAVVAKKEHMTLENFGCGGATTSSVLTAIGCLESGFGPVAAFDAVPYPSTTQEQAALTFIAENPGRVGLITISIGGNDVTSCANAGSIGAIETCVTAADALISTDVGSLVAALDSALSTAGDTTAKVVGLTYPDVILGDWVYPAGSADTNLARASVAAFDALINPTLSAAYGASNFVNVTQAPYKTATAGVDTPLTTTQKDGPYGVIPSAVAEICKLTYFCALGNIHANDKGYKFIGGLIVSHLAA